MDTLKANYRDEEEDNSSSQTEPNTTTEATVIETTTTITTETTTTITTEITVPTNISENQISPIKVKEEPEEIISEEISEGEISDDENEEEEEEEDPQQTQKRILSKPSPVSEEEEDDDDEEEENTPKAKKRKSLSSFASQNSPITVKSESPKVPETPETPATDTPTPPAEAEAEAAVGGGGAAAAAVVEGSAVFRRPKKKANNVWTKSTSRKGKKKTKPNGNNNVVAEDTVLITPFPKFTDKGDDSPDLKICLSKVYKAEQIELSEDRLSAGSSKGYRMVRATRGVMEGAWYFEIKVSNLGETGHTRLGWSTEKGDLQAPVGYFGNGFAYRDVDGSKVYKAVREKYGEEGYFEGDVIGFYINLPEGSSYAPKPPHLVMYKGQRYAYVPDGKEESPKVVPGSEISFFKNGVCQGVAFKDLCGGRYYPAASMYTLPHQPNCVVKFNFGPDFDCFPQDFEGRPIPTPMIEVPYHESDGRVENDESAEKKH